MFIQNIINFIPLIIFKDHKLSLNNSISLKIYINIISNCTVNSFIDNTESPWMYKNVINAILFMGYSSGLLKRFVV